MAPRALGVDLAAGGEDAQGDRQVEAPGILRQIGRREIDGESGRRLIIVVSKKRRYPSWT